MISLFFGAFLAATILPFSSEIMLFTALKAGEIDKWLLVGIAATGNTAGAVLNWWLGRFVLHWSDHRWFPFSPAQLQRATDRFAKYGIWSLLFSWVPVIGDPLTFASGALKVPFTAFLILVAIGKSARYIVFGFAA
ncbi:MAG: YqaA family protein [Parvibaculum sp.]